jgi:hypothetical protein
MEANGGHKGILGVDFGRGAVTQKKLFPPVLLTTQIERNGAQAQRFWNRRGYMFGQIIGRD